MKKHIKNHDEILQLSSDVTSGLYRISSEITYDQLKEMGYEITASYSYESERGDEKDVAVYQKDDSRIVKISNYIAREGGMYMDVTFVPVEMATNEYKSEIEKEMENPSIYLIASILNRRKIKTPKGDGFYDYANTLGNYHFDMILSNDDLTAKIITRFKELIQSGNYEAKNPNAFEKVMSVMEKIMEMK